MFSMMMKARCILFLVLFIISFGVSAWASSSGCILEITGKVVSVKERNVDVPSITGGLERVIFLDMKVEIKKINSVARDAYDPTVDCEKAFKGIKKVDVSVAQTSTFLMNSNASIVQGSVITGNLSVSDEGYGTSYSLSNIELIR